MDGYAYNIAFNDRWGITPLTCILRLSDTYCILNVRLKRRILNYIHDKNHCAHINNLFNKTIEQRFIIGCISSQTHNEKYITQFGFAKIRDVVL